MPFSSDHLAELNLLASFRSPSSQEGLKVHSHEAAPELVSAAQRLFDKGLITQHDGGYLTSRGVETLECIQQLQGLLTAR